MKSCLECRYHEKITDPEPNDWFCDDDITVVCTKKPNPNKDLNSDWVSDWSDYRHVCESCRPHRLEKDCLETGIPDWCPIK